MATSILTADRESLRKIGKMLEKDPDKHLLTQRIRLCRVKLGAVLDRLESFEPGPRALEELNEHSDNITFGIDALVESIREMGR